MHEGHRKRIREKYKLNGLNGFASHEVLELLLFYSTPRGDTNPAAHALLKKFGSLPAVFEASYDELIKVPGVGDAAATLITLVPQLFRRYANEKCADRKTVTSKQEAADYLMPNFFGLTAEHIGMLCLDTQGRINNFVFVAEGSLKLAQIDIRKSVQAALNCNAACVIFAHNHPGGLPNPSRNDVETTQALVKAFGTIGIRVADHFIISDNDFFSMAGSDKFAPLFLIGETALAPKTKFSLY